MPENILVDLNIILDVLLERSGHQASQSILELQQLDRAHVFISGHAVTTFAYLLEHAKVPNAEIRRHLHWLLQTFSVVDTNQEILMNALPSQIADYEDALVEQAAISCNASRIITRNTKDFIRSRIPATSPESFIS